MSQANVISKPGASAGGGGEFAFSHRNFVQIAALLYEQCGIHLTEGKENLVYSRLAKRLRRIGCPDFDTYCAMLASPSGAEERNAMMAALTTNHTRYFREPHHFDHLREKLVPEFERRARAGERIRIWSAACSSGEEPYSIAMTLVAAMPDIKRYDLKILATDVDPNVLDTARKGIYREETVQPVPADLRNRWMTRDRDAGTWQVSPDLRSLITFNALNLMGEWPMRGPFDAIFCRNVAIYFDNPTQVRLWSRFRRVLAPTARLYIGHSERIDGDEYVSDGLTVYQPAGVVR
jgi:chemotaxis protein methyltransferase CheR